MLDFDFEDMLAQVKAYAYSLGGDEFSKILWAETSQKRKWTNTEFDVLDVRILLRREASILAFKEPQTFWIYMIYL